MRMAVIDELQSLVPPPSQPKAAEGDWKALESELGVRFPDDYKSYIQTYGSGTLCTYFYIVSPFELLDPPRAYWANWASFYKDMAELGEVIPYPFYPSVPGLFPIGTYGDVDILNWLTAGEPENWSFVYYDRTEGFFDLGNIGFVQFLVSVLRGESGLPTAALGTHVLSKPFVFRQD